MGRHLTKQMQAHIEWIQLQYRKDPKVADIYTYGMTDTYLKTMKKKRDGSTFVITGDIPAMWLRDAAAQVRPLLLLAGKDPEIAGLIEGVILSQKRQIMIDPYANAFNDGPTGEGHQEDRTEMKPELWERKYEIDSLCYPIQLTYLYWKATGAVKHLDGLFNKVCWTVIETFRTEQHHASKSLYSFERDEDEEERVIYETLPNDGKGSPVAKCGMTWSAFRPSDDACTYGYLIPSNMFAVVVLRYMAEMASQVMNSEALAQEAIALADELENAIESHGTFEHPIFGKVYRYEIDGMDNGVLMDDANVPSLLSIPYFGYRDMDDPIYQNTRKLILSRTNPYYFQGSVLKGIGSPHTPTGYVWPIALAVQGLTTSNEEEQKHLLEMLKSSDDDTHMMHEGVDVNNPSKYTRPWFSWANAMFSEFILALNGRWVPGSPLERYWKDR